MPSRDLNNGDRHPAYPITVLATVGSTRFDHLVSTLLSPAFLDSIAREQTSTAHQATEAFSTSLGTRTVELTIQYGSTPIADILTADDSPFLTSRDENSVLNPAFGLYHKDGEGLINRSRHPEAFDGGLTGSLNLGIASNEEVEKTGLRRRAQDPRDHGRSGKPETEKLNSRPAGFQEDEDWVDFIDDESGVLENGACFKNDQASMFQSGILEATSPQGVRLKLFPYTQNLKEYLEIADIIISHAGSGTILEVLRLPKFQKADSSLLFPRLVVVPNTSLMDNHQVELAEALSSKHYLTQSLPQDLIKHIQSILNAKIKSASVPNAFPKFDPSRFRQLIDEEMGFH